MLLGFRSVSSVVRKQCSFFQSINRRGLSEAVAVEIAGGDAKPPVAREKSKRDLFMKEKYPVMNIHDAVTKIKTLNWAKFDETIEISVNMGLDPRKPNQSVKGIAKLPSGTGKPVRICVFAVGNDAKEALEAGADVVGSDDLVPRFVGGDTKFDTVIATPDMMGFVGKVGKVINQ